MSVELRSNGEIGITDRPSRQDTLSVGAYIDGLAEFLAACPTPMTVAVQGDWGSGKTSAMLMVDDKLKARESSDSAILPVWFNTWQYAQFDVSRNLALSLIGSIADELDLAHGGDNRATAELKERVWRILAGVAEKTVRVAAKALAPGLVSDAVDAGIEVVKESVRPAVARDDLAAQLTGLREAFAKAVAATGKRLVVFVDDLDRLQPGRAVEVMEAIKVFLDVPNCVFVLAIDFDVVRTGVAEKYQAEEFDERKARAFFDKIIQVPFQMPVGTYDVRGFFAEALAQVGIVPANAEEVGQFINLAQHSVSTNPRSTKRLLNTFVLLRAILRTTAPGSARFSDVQLFSALCLQAAYPEVYNDVVRELSQDSGEPTWVGIATGGDGRDGEELPKSWRVLEGEEEALLTFLGLFHETFLLRGSAKSFGWEAFSAVMGSTAVTASGTTARPTLTGRRTLFDEGDKRRLLVAAGISPASIDLGFELEGLLRGSGFTLGAQPKSPIWTVYLDDPEAEGGKGALFGEVEFSKKWIKLSFCNTRRMADDPAVIDPLINRARDGLSTGRTGVEPVVQKTEQRYSLRMVVRRITDSEQLPVIVSLFNEAAAAMQR